MENPSGFSFLVILKTDIVRQEVCIILVGSLSVFLYLWLSQLLVRLLHIKTAKLSSLSNSQYTSFSSRMRHDTLMYLIDTDKERDNNIFVQFNFPTLHEAKNVGIKFNNYLNSGENEFKYVDMGLTKTFRNIKIYLLVCLLISIGNFYFNPQNN